MKLAGGRAFTGGKNKGSVIFVLISKTVSRTLTVFLFPEVFLLEQGDQPHTGCPILEAFDLS